MSMLRRDSQERRFFARLTVPRFFFAGDLALADSFFAAALPAGRFGGVSPPSQSASGAQLCAFA